MTNLIKLSSEEKNLLKPIYGFAKRRRVKLYLVGGFLRDKLLGRKKDNLDFDFALKRGAITFGRELGQKMRCGFVVLDKEHGACRVVKKLDGKLITFDFTDFRGPSIEEDLKHRDFTINTLCLNPEGELLDINGARVDLKKKVIRLAGKRSFDEDALRILRAFSFSAMLGFEVEKETLKEAKAKKKKLSGISFERIRDELFKVLASPSAYPCSKRLDELKILEIIFPEFKKMRGIGQGPYHHLDVWQHTLETLKQLEELMEGEKRPEIKAYLDAEISSGRQRYALLKLGALLHDIGKPAALRHVEGKLIFHGHERIGLGFTREIVNRLKLSNEESRLLHKCVMHHLRPGYLADSDMPTERAKFRYFRDAGSEALSILLLSLADQRATKGPLTTRNARLQHEKVVAALIKEYLKKSKVKKCEKLVNGHDIMKHLKLEPSKLVGKILSELEELQAIGKIKTKEEALSAAARLKPLKKVMHRVGEV